GMGNFLSDYRNFKAEVNSKAVNGEDFSVVTVTFLEPVLKMQQDVGKQVSKLLNVNKEIPVITRQERWVNASDEIVYQIWNYGNGGNLISGIKYSHLETNVDLSASLFKLASNVSVDELTDTNQLAKEVVKRTVAGL